MRQGKPDRIWGNEHLATNTLRELCAAGDLLMFFFFFIPVFLCGEGVAASVFHGWTRDGHSLIVEVAHAVLFSFKRSHRSCSALGTWISTTCTVAH